MHHSGLSLADWQAGCHEAHPNQILSFTMQASRASPGFSSQIAKSEILF
jgi:hypothetical protein